MGLIVNFTMRFCGRCLRYRNGPRVYKRLSWPLTISIAVFPNIKHKAIIISGNKNRITPMSTKYGVVDPGVDPLRGFRIKPQKKDRKIPAKIRITNPATLVTKGLGRVNKTPPGKWHISIPSRPAL